MILIALHKIISLLLMCFLLTTVSELLQKNVAQDSHLCLMASGKDCHEKSTEIFASKRQQLFISCSVDTNFIKNSQIRWRRNNQEITSSPPYSIAWERGKLLMIRPVIVGITDGYYECVANIGSVELQKSVKVTVKNELPNGFPQIKTHPVNIRQPERKIIDFNCVVSGKKPLQVIWFHNRVPITSTNNYYVHTYKSLESSDLFISNLSLRNVSNFHTGFYQCVAFNEYGQDASHQAMFSVAPKRFRRETSLDDGWFSKNCSNEHESSTAFKEIRMCCKHGHGFYFNLQWINPSFENELVKSLTVGLYFNGIPYCSLQSNRTTEIKLPENKLDQTSNKLNGFIKIPKVSTSFSIKLDQCAPENVGTCSSHTSEPIKIFPEGSQSYQTVYIVFALVLSIIIIVSSVWIVLRVRRKCFYGKMSKVPNYNIKNRVVYISHCASTEKEKDKVLSLATKLHSISNVQVCIDLCNQNSILNVGGLSIWVPENLEKADKIIMVFSRLYLEAIKSQLQTEEILKVNTEADLIRKLLYKNCQRSSRFAVVLDGVKKEEIPAEFYGRAHFTFPKNFNGSDRNWKSLLGYVLDINPIYLQLKDLLRSS